VSRAFPTTALHGWLVRIIEVDLGASHAVELKAVIEAQRTGLPILVTRDGAKRQRIFVLEPHDERLWVGRGAACDVQIEWDEKASRSHAELVRLPDGWAIVDDGLSRNGTFVGADRVIGRRRLHDGDVVRFGDSSATYRLPASYGASTMAAEDTIVAPTLTPTQRRVLSALCRPLWDAQSPALPATNPAIAAELVLSVEAIKSHMRALFGKFAVEDLPQNQKRARLAELAMQAGLASRRDV
jgi:pSer/pThr/pTyr-binding forkhead associated (FHA) protein